MLLLLLNDRTMRDVDRRSLSLVLVGHKIKRCAIMNNIINLTQSGHVRSVIGFSLRGSAMLLRFRLVPTRSIQKRRY